MLRHLCPKIRKCHIQAARARRRANQADGPFDREIWEAVEQSWLTLAASYEFADTIDDFLGHYGEHSAGADPLGSTGV